jgi:glycosyltransferase involved in cell wall biosynthesis
MLINDTSLSAQIEINLKIVGEGPERDHLQHHIEALGLGHRISLAGARHDIPDVLAAFDLFVLSSDREGHPLTALEAQAAGTAVVLTDAGGSREAIATGEGRYGGVLVEPELESLSAAIGQMILNPQLLHESGLFAREYALKNFDKLQMIDQYEKLFCEVSGADNSKSVTS